MNWKALLQLAISAFLLGGVNGVHLYLRDHQDFNFEQGFSALLSVFIVSGVSGAVAHAIKSPLVSKSEETNDDTSSK
jgi:uncharacterized membrane protein